MKFLLVFLIALIISCAQGALEPKLAGLESISGRLNEDSVGGSSEDDNMANVQELEATY